MLREGTGCAKHMHSQPLVVAWLLTNGEVRRLPWRIGMRGSRHSQDLGTSRFSGGELARQTPYPFSERRNMFQYMEF